MIKDPVVATDITDITFGTNISAASVNFSVYVKESTMDPQEFPVAYTQHLPCNFMTIEDRVKPIIIDENDLGISTVLQIVLMLQCALSNN